MPELQIVFFQSKGVTERFQPNKRNTALDFFIWTTDLRMRQGRNHLIVCLEKDITPFLSHPTAFVGQVPVKTFTANYWHLTESSSSKVS